MFEYILGCVKHGGNFSDKFLMKHYITVYYYEWQISIYLFSMIVLLFAINCKKNHTFFFLVHIKNVMISTTHLAQG